MLSLTRQTPLSQYSISEIDNLQTRVLAREQTDHVHFIQRKIRASFFHSHYAQLHVVAGELPPYLASSLPWPVKRLISCIRVDPSCLHLSTGFLNLDPTAACFFCSHANKSWPHFIHCLTLRHFVTPPNNIPLPITESDLMRALSNNIDPRIAWFLHRLAKYILSNCNVQTDDDT